MKEPKMSTGEDAKFAAVFEYSGMGIVLLDREGRIIQANPRFQELLGYSAQELLGQKYSLFVHPDDVAASVERMRQVFADEMAPYQLERRWIRKDGCVLEFRQTVSAIRAADGRPQSVIGMMEDITEQKQALSKLHQLSRAVEQSPASIIVTNKAGEITYVNPKFTAVTGYAPEEVMGRNPRFLKGGETSEREYKKLWQTINSGKEWHGIFHNRKKNGGLFWERASISPLLNENGEVTGFLAVKEDITHDLEVKHELRETKDFSGAIVADAPVGIFVYESSGQCVLANTAAARTINSSVEQLLAQNFRALDSWKQSGMLAAAERTLSTWRSEQGEFHIRTTFGRNAWLNCRFSVVMLREQPSLLVLVEDISYRKEAERKLRKQAALLDQTHEAIWTLDEKRRISFWNKGAERMYGWTAEEALGKTAIDLLHGGLISPKLAEVIKESDETGHWEGEIEEFTKSGTRIIVAKKVNRIVTGTDERGIIMVICTDITEHQKLEAQLRRAQRLESLGTLASGIAHDLNNVLTPILFSVQILSKKADDDDSRRVLETLESAVKRGAELVRQVLTFARGAGGQKVSVSPKQIIREIQKIIKETFPKNIELDCILPPDTSNVLGDPTQIHQVLLNLCINARDAMPGGGKLSIKVANVVFDNMRETLNMKAAPGPYVAIRVSDNGTGMPRDVQERLFEPFFTTKPAGKGTGLGLSTSLGIIREHGGIINCYSEFGKGTAFVVYLPVANGAASRAARKTAEELPRGHNELLLVVDDEEPIRQVAQKTLERFGYRVAVASNGLEGLKIYRERKQEIAAVITDMMMPTMDGATMMKELKKIEPAIRIIASSGLEMNGASIRAEACGAAKFIGKPYTAESLLLSLQELLHPKN